MLRTLKFWFSRFWDHAYTGNDRIDRAICWVAECFPAGWYDQNDPVPAEPPPAARGTILDTLRATVRPEEYNRSLADLVEMHRDARLMLLIDRGVGFSLIAHEFWGYDPALLWVLYSHLRNGK